MTKWPTPTVGSDDSPSCRTALVAPLGLALEGGDHCHSVGGVHLRLLMIDADDVAPLAELHRLGAVVGLLATRLALEGERHEGRRIGEHHLVHQLVRGRARALDVEQHARFKRGDRLGADHPAVDHHAHPADGEASPQPVDHHNQGRDVDRVARPHYEHTGRPSPSITTASMISLRPGQ
jgi:hypothetical protein